MTVEPMQRDAASAEFFDATARGELLIKRCQHCGHVGAPSISSCRACGSSDLSWVTSAGAGTVASWTRTHQRPTADGEVVAPIVIGIVELQDGPWVFGQIVGDLPDPMTSGLRVIAEFVTPDGGEAIPVFRVDADERES